MWCGFKFKGILDKVVNFVISFEFCVISKFSKVIYGGIKNSLVILDREV